MRIGLVYHQFVSTGGMEKYLLGLTRRLLERGHEVTVVTAKTDAVTEALPVKWRQLRGGALRDFSRQAAAVLPELGVERVAGFGRTVAQDVHRAGGGCHALYSRLLPWYKRWRPKNRMELGLERELYTGGRTARFVVNAAPVALQLQAEYGVAAERFTVIHTAVDTAVFHPGEAGPGNERPVFLYAGSNHRRKGLDALLAALAELPEADLWIAGEPLGARYRGMISRLSLGGRVRVLGAVDDMAALYRKADFFVHPTLYDACANTVLQSMASGLPGIISTADGAHEFIEDGGNGWLLRNPRDAGELHAKMKAVLALSASERAAVGAAARARVLPLTWEAHVGKWEAVLGEGWG